MYAGEPENIEYLFEAIATMSRCARATMNAYGAEELLPVPMGPSAPECSEDAVDAVLVLRLGVTGRFL